jgi:methyl coenzyme M reductase subunit D
LQSEKNLEILINRYQLFLQQKDLKDSKEKLKESFDSKLAVSYNELSGKVGEDIPIVKKPKTLKEFLNYGETSETTAT